jgi:uncharacterized protein YecT (DUF1311 family)
MKTASHAAVSLQRRTRHAVVPLQRRTRHAVASWRRRIALLLALAALTLPALAQTQSEMNAEAAADFKKADAKLNAVYKKVKASLGEDGLENLKVAQRAWIAYRDAEAVLEAAPNEGGSIYPLIFASVKTRMTEARTEELQAIIDDPNQVSGDDDSETPKDAKGNAYGKDYNPNGADDPNM